MTKQKIKFTENTEGLGGRKKNKELTVARQVSKEKTMQTSFYDKICKEISQGNTSEI